MHPHTGIYIGPPNPSPHSPHRSAHGTSTLDNLGEWPTVTVGPPIPPSLQPYSDGIERQVSRYLNATSWGTRSDPAPSLPSPAATHMPNFTRETIQIPTQAKGVSLHAWLYKPNTPPPFPVVIAGHG